MITSVLHKYLAYHSPDPSELKPLWLQPNIKNCGSVHLLFVVIAIIIIILLVLLTGDMTVIVYLKTHLTAFPLHMWLNKQTLLRESGMVLLSAPTVTSAIKCAYKCYLKWIFQSCSSQKISIYLKLLHLIPLDCFYAWKKSGSSIQYVLYLKKQQQKTTQQTPNRSGCSKTQT